MFTDFACSHWPEMSAVRIETYNNRMQICVYDAGSFLGAREEEETRPSKAPKSGSQTSLVY